MNKKARPFEINTQSRHSVYRKRFNEFWFNTLDIKLMLCFDFLWDKCGYGGVVDPDNVTDFNMLILKDEKEFIDKQYFLDEINKYKRQIRELENDMWLIENYAVTQNKALVLDFSNKYEKGHRLVGQMKAAGWVKGIYNDCKRNNVCPSTLIGFKVILPAEDRPHTEKEYDEAINEEHKETNTIVDDDLPF